MGNAKKYFLLLLLGSLVLLLGGVTVHAADAPIVYQAESLIYSLSANASAQVSYDPNAAITNLVVSPEMTEPNVYLGKYVEFDINIPKAGTYSIGFNIKMSNPSGSYYFYVNGRKFGGTCAFWFSPPYYKLYSQGTGTFPAGVSKFRFVCMGKDSRSTLGAHSSDMIIDYITVTRQEDVAESVYTSISGNKSATDYQASIDITVDPNSTGNNKAELLVRARPSSLYGDFYYAAGFSNASKLVLEKSYAGNVTTLQSLDIGSYNDGVKRTVMVNVLDNVINVYLNGVLKIQYTDTALPNLVGGTGTYCEGSKITLGGITIASITDSLGGDYDNYYGGAFDQAQ